MQRRHAEGSVRKLLANALAPAIAIARDIESVCRSCIEDVDESEDPGLHRVRAIFAGQLADDLRALQLLAPIGYANQVATLGASAYEVAYLMAFVWDSEERATAWLSHDNVKSLPWPRKKYVTAALAKALPGDANAIEREEVIYSFLCWHKHANPKALQRFAPSATPARHALNSDPDIRSPKHAVGCLLLSLRAPVIALMALGRGEHLRDDMTATLLRAGKQYFGAENRLLDRLRS